MINTYEGKHNHEQPPPRRKRHQIQLVDDEEDEDEDEDDGLMTFQFAATGNFLNNPNPAETDQVHTLQLRNDMNPDQFANGFLSPNNHFGSFNNNINMNIGSSSYTPQMHYYSSLNNTKAMPQSSYGLNFGSDAAPQPGPSGVPGAGDN